MRGDFVFICDLAAQFFSQTHIKKRLQQIEAHDISGWEIWLQIEFSVFIATHTDVAEWWRECLYKIDRRYTPKRQHMMIDFVLRKKHTAREEYIALEIKQHMSASTCIKNMVTDIDKVYLVRNSEDDLRTVCALGVHPCLETAELQHLIDHHTCHWDTNIPQNWIRQQAIAGTQLAYSIFGYE